MSQATALETLIQSLTSVGAKYLVTGSVASSAQGIPRFTRDTDLVVQLGGFQMARLATALGRDWYMDPDFARESFSRGRSFSVIHIPSGSKFDLFPANSEFHDSELTRAAVRSVTLASGSVSCYVATAEDIILSKLRWYRDGGQVSEQQWSDIGGMLAVNRNLDFTYLDHWAKRLQVADLLDKAVKMAQESL